MKTYHLYHARSRQSHSKLQRVQTQRRVELESKKSSSSKRVQRYDKQTEKVCIIPQSSILCYIFIADLLAYFWHAHETFERSLDSHKF